MSDVYGDRRRAESFGAAAPAYDRFRPSYPAELVTWLTGPSPGSAVDVGCGTGQLSRLLRAAGWQVTGVEIDANMAAVAESHGIRVDVAPFEAWTPDTQYDLVASAQAWHWVDPAIGYTKAASALGEGGRLGLIWNSYHYDDAVGDVFDRVFGRYAPDLLVQPVPLGRVALDHASLDAEAADGMQAAGFAEPDIRVFDHERHMSPADLVAELGTHSPIAVLANELRRGLLEDLARDLDAISPAGEALRVRHHARVTTAALLS